MKFRWGLADVLRGITLVVVTISVVAYLGYLPYWNVLPASILLLAMRRSVDAQARWGLISIACLLTAFDFCWHLPIVFRSMGFPERSDQLNQLVSLALGTLTIPMAFAVAAIGVNRRRRKTNSGGLRLNLACAVIAWVDLGLLSILVVQAILAFS
ncbi:MAG: hypothetical protein AAFX06_04340 [Planctomycetota bacterium]